MNLYGQDMDEIGYALSKRGLAGRWTCPRRATFIGRDALTARPQRHQLLGLLLLDKGVLRSHQMVRTAPR